MAIVTINIAGDVYGVAAEFSDSRVAIIFNDAPVLADKVDGEWRLSAIPASPEEQKVLNELWGPMDTTVVVTKPKM